MQTTKSNSLAAIAALLTVLGAAPASGQSTTENSKGESAVILPDGPLAGGTILVNTENSSVRFVFLDRSTAQRFYYGVEAAAKASNGVGSLFKGTDVAPGARLAVNLGRHSIATDPREGGNFDWLNLTVGYEVSRFTMFDGARAFSNQITRSTLSSPVVAASYGYLWRGSVFVVGTLGVSRQNNYQELEEVTVKQAEVISGPSGITRTITREIKARIGSLTESRLGTARLDALVVPGFVDNRLGLAFYGDTGFADDLQRGTTIGGALHILRRRRPSQSLGAVVLEIADVFGAHANRDLRRQLKVFVQAGVPFGFTP